jgi:hypothetical protein
VTAEHDVLDLIAEVATDQTRGFRASYVAKRTNKSLDDVQRELVAMVDDGRLDVFYELLCPDSGRLIHRYASTDPLPIGQTIERDDCEAFEATLSSFWVTYKPSANLAMELLRRATHAGKGRARRSLLRRALSRMGIGSTVTAISSLASMSRTTHP